MKTMLKIVILGFAAVLMFAVDMALDFGWVPDAEGVLGRQRRTRRRGAAVGYAAGSASASAAQQDAAAAEAEADAAKQEAAEAEAELEAYKQQDAAAEQQGAAPAPAPTSMVASLPDGCVTAGDVFNCGGVYYKPFMSGNQIVYGVVPGP